MKDLAYMELLSGIRRNNSKKKVVNPAQARGDVINRRMSPQKEEGN